MQGYLIVKNGLYLRFDRQWTDKIRFAVVCLTNDEAWVIAEYLEAGVEPLSEEDFTKNMVYSKQDRFLVETMIHYKNRLS